MERKEMPTSRGIARGNQLKNATSPYLLQHADNPVDWYQWGEDAFEKARKENKPIFLSIGYSTCHWCHVMAHESFEDAKTADLLNKYFVSIKVDREERPDIDSVYMAVCQSFTGSGGWPMSIFMTWDKKPFFAGTYFPPHSRYGMPSFTDVLSAIEEKWSDKSEGHDEIIQAADEIIAHLNKDEESSKEVTYKDNAIEKAALIFKHIFDSKHGGFGPAPKFPTPHNLMFLIMYAELNKDTMALKMAETTLIKMRKGGIFDHIGYGFSRYSTDKYFLAPHFEKMLYDNALLIMAYSAAYSVTKRDVYLDTAKKTAEYVLREMRSPEGGFYSAQDADSEGVEGKFYTFTLEEVMSVLGEEKGKELARVYDVTEKGNFEGANILNLLKSNDLEADYDKELQMLYEYRKKRTSLHLDDKQLCSWNSLMIAAFAMLYRVARDEKYLEAAEKAKAFIDKKLRKDKELFISYREGKCTGHGLIYDYAFYVAALLELYSSTLNKEYLCQAEEFCDEAVKGFGDASNGAVNGYYLCRTDSKELFMNPKEIYDGAIPSGNSVMAYNLVRLYQLTEKDKYARLAESQIKWMSAKIGDYPAGYTTYLLARLIYENPPKHVIVVLKDESELSEIKKTLPLLANILVTEESKEYPIINDKTTYYVCKGHTCFPPTNTINF